MRDTPILLLNDILKELLHTMYTFFKNKEIMYLYAYVCVSKMKRKCSFPHSSFWFPKRLVWHSLGHTAHNHLQALEPLTLSSG